MEKIPLAVGLQIIHADDENDGKQVVYDDWESAEASLKMIEERLK